MYLPQVEENKPQTAVSSYTFSCSSEHTGLRFYGNWNKDHRTAFRCLIGSLALLQPSYLLGIHPAFYGWVFFFPSSSSILILQIRAEKWH